MRIYEPIPREPCWEDVLDVLKKHRWVYLDQLAEFWASMKRQ